MARGPAAAAAASILLLLLLLPPPSIIGASPSPPKKEKELTYKLPRRPVQRVKSPAPSNPLGPQQPYLYSIGDPRIDSFLPTYLVTTSRFTHTDRADVPCPLEHVVEMGVRLPGTRSALHMHDQDGILCVIKGQITLFTNDSAQVPSRTAGPGECYNMPAGVLMTAANTGKTPAQIIDIFDVVPGAPVATIREPVCWRDVPGGKSPQVEYYRCPR